MSDVTINICPDKKNRIAWHKFTSAEHTKIGYFKGENTFIYKILVQPRAGLQGTEAFGYTLPTEAFRYTPTHI
jgi:hypothetical protein